MDRKEECIRIGRNHRFTIVRAYACEKIKQSHAGLDILHEIMNLYKIYQR